MDRDFLQEGFSAFGFSPDFPPCPGFRIKEPGKRQDPAGVTELAGPAVEATLNAAP